MRLSNRSNSFFLLLLAILLLTNVYLLIWWNRQNSLEPYNNKPAGIPTSSPSVKYDLPNQITFEEMNGIEIEVEEVLNDQSVRISIIDTTSNKKVLVKEPLQLWASVNTYISPNREHIVLSSGSYIFRSTFLISLNNGELMLPNFTGGRVFLTDEYFVFEDLDGIITSDHPYEYVDVVVMDLNNALSKTIFKSDSLNTYNIENVGMDTVTVKHYYVSESNQWVPSTDGQVEYSEETLMYKL